MAQSATQDHKKLGAAPRRLLRSILPTAFGLVLVSCAQNPIAEPDGPVSLDPPSPKLSRWVRVPWSDLPGWSSDSVQLAWPAFLRSCQGRPVAPWLRTCQRARALGPQADEAQVRQWLQQELTPYRIESTNGEATGRLTGYYEPSLVASRVRTATFSTPLYRPPADLRSPKPWYSRAEMESDPNARAALAGREIAWLADPVEAVFLQVQGSGRLDMVNAQGQAEGTVRLAFAAHNDQPFKPLSSWLVEQGAITLAQANADAIRTWAQANPSRAKDLANANPRVVFFKEEPLPDPSVGPKGSQGVPLTSGRSVAVDRDSIPLGTPLWLDSTEPQKWQSKAPPARPLQRLVVAQDTGGAIKGAVRADFFWGWGEGAGEFAGRTKQDLRLWALWPRQ